MRGDVQGYFISPEGKSLPLRGSHERHINHIIKNPKKYGLSKQGIEKVYKKHKEYLGSEGKARDELFTMMLKKGWGRVRDLGSGFTVQVWRLTNRMRDAIYALFRKLRPDYGPLTPIYVHSLSSNTGIHSNMTDIGKAIYGEGLAIGEAIEYLLDNLAE